MNEKAEDQLELTERDIEKAMNIKLHQNEIKSRPKKNGMKQQKKKEKKLNNWEKILIKKRKIYTII